MKYKVREGFSVRLDEKTVFLGGEIIELDDETAAAHAVAIEAVEDEPVKARKN